MSMMSEDFSSRIALRRDASIRCSFEFVLLLSLPVLVLAEVLLWVGVPGLGMLGLGARPCVSFLGRFFRVFVGVCVCVCP